MKKNIERIASEWAIREREGLDSAEKEALEDWLSKTPEAKEMFNEMQKAWDMFEPIADTHYTPEAATVKWIRPAKVWAIAALLLVAVSAFVFKFSNQQDTDFDSSRISVAWNDTDYISLPDGSSIDLNESAEIQYDFDQQKRSIWLQKGEAYFSVAKDELRPFVVHANNTVITALGTEFIVNLKAQMVELIVSEGSVNLEVNEPEESIIIDLANDIESNRVVHEKQKVVIYNQTELEKGFVISLVSEEQLSSLLAWKPETLVFKGAPLSEVVAAFNRYNEQQLIISDDRIKEIQIVANLRSNKINGFLETLRITSNIFHRYEDNVYYLYQMD